MFSEQLSLAFGGQHLTGLSGNRVCSYRVNLKINKNVVVWVLRGGLEVGNKLIELPSPARVFSREVTE